MSVSRRRADPEDTAAAEDARRDPRIARIYAAARKHRRDLTRANADASERMYQAWLTVLEDIRPRIDAITQRIAQARAAGEAVNPAWLYQQARYRELLTGANQGFDRYSQKVYNETLGLQRLAADRAIDAAYELMRGAFGRTTDPDSPTVLIRPGIEEMADIVGFLGSGSPLQTLLSTFGTQAAEAIGKALTVGIVTGQSPIEIARGIRRAASIPRSRAETIARTELHRTFREATQRTFEANKDVVTGWIWHAAQQRRTCAACWAMHGTFHPVEERLHGHVRCRCAMLPQTKTWEELGISGVQDERITVPLGSDLFDRLSERDQAFILGPTKYGLFKDGSITLPDLATRHKNPIWGDSWQESTIAQALGAALTRRKAAQRLSRPPRAPRKAKTPPGQGAAPTAPDFKPGAQVRAEIEALYGSFNAQIQAELDAITAGRERLGPEWDAIGNRRVDLVQIKLEHGGHTPAQEAEYTRLGQREQDIAEQMDKLTERQIAAQRSLREGPRRRILEDILYVENGASFKAAGAPNRPSERASDDQRYRHTAWAEGSDAFRRLIGTGHLDDRRITYKRIKPSGRAFYQNADESINMAGRASRDGASIVVHELGHWLEARSPGFHDEIQRHYDARAQGEAVEKFKDLFPNHNYKENELLRRDKWIDPYSGKDYNAMYPGRTILNSEVVSMTLQQLFENPYNMVTADPETFDLVWRLLRSKNLKP